MPFIAKNSPVAITGPNYAKEPLSGIVTTAMAYGALVMLKDSGSPQDARELVAATGGVRPAILCQDVLSEVDWQAFMLANPQYRNNLRTPVNIGAAVSARFADFAEFEGPAYFDTITGSTAVKTPLTMAAGKFKAATLATDEVIGYLSRKITPVNGATFRWEVRFV